MNSIIMAFLIVRGLIISEIMPDPDPAVGLPPYEFVEWYNPGSDTINLDGWQWVVGEKVKRLSGGQVLPCGFVIVCSPAAASAFRVFGPVIAMESFPALRNTGDRLTLINPDGIVVHTMEYSPDQFTDVLKSNGGWSLEVADLTHFYNIASWLPSSDPSGGTPGRLNSRQITVPDPDPCRLIRAAGYDENRFVLLFSESLDPGLDVNNYSCRLMPGDIYASAAPVPEYGFPGLFFLYPDGLDRNIIYSLNLEGTITDCSGKSALIRPVNLGFPMEPDSADVIISEIMFDPLAGQTEFVEVFNRSDRVMELRDLILARANAAGTIVAFSDQQDLSYWLYPHCYAVLTADVKSFGKAWPAADPAIPAGRPDMISLTNEESQLILMKRNQMVLDRVTYSPDWHYPYLEETKGVSLERVDFETSGADPENWLSASAASGYSTPGAKNSSEMIPGSPSLRQFSIDNTNGYASSATDPVQVALNYRFGETGWFLTVRIFTGLGNAVKVVFPFSSVGMEGTVYWNGLDSGQRLVPDGIYLVVADYYHPSGKKGRWKQACAVLRGY